MRGLFLLIFLCLLTQAAFGQTMLVSPAVGNPLIIQGPGTVSTLSGVQSELVLQDYSTTHSTLIDAQAVNSGSALKDRAYYLNPGFRWWDAGHEESDVDFGGYRNGVNEVFAGLSAGCLSAFNNNGFGIACPVNVDPTFQPATTDVWDLGLPAFRWNKIYGVSYFAGASATVGVTCSGTPTALFASVNGIVTHC